jgi:UPF0755 protein
MKKRTLKRALATLLVAVAAAASWLLVYAFSELPLRQVPLEFSIRAGSSLRGAAHQMTDADVLPDAYRFEILARIMGAATSVKAGNYELQTPVTPVALLRKITSGDYTLVAVTFVEGWNFRQVRDALDQQPALVHRIGMMDRSQILQALGIADDESLEGWFFPETYYVSSGETDLNVLRRAHRLMQAHLEREWAKRDPSVPLTDPYQALILASLVEKETGRPEDRGMVAAVLLNRLQRGMKLQTDPSVIYGLGEAFDGNLRKRDLLADHPYNTYTRTGMPPTPIAMPGLASLRAALHPAATDALYFVARGDGTSQFSRTLEEHERAVAKWQKASKR